MIENGIAEIIKQQLQSTIDELDMMSVDEMLSRLNALHQYVAESSANDLFPFLENGDGIVSKLCDNEPDKKICMAKRKDGDISVAILPAHVPYSVGTLLYPDRIVDFRISGGRNDEASVAVCKLYDAMGRKS